MTGPFSKEWKPTGFSESQIKRIRAATGISKGNTARRAADMASDDPERRRIAAGRIAGMGRDEPPIEARPPRRPKP